MKNLTLFLPLCILLMALTACEKENLLDQESEVPSVLSTKAKKHPVPFHAEFTSTLVVSPPQPNPGVCGTGFPFLHVDQVLDGNATHLGKIEGTISSCFDVTTSTLSDVRFSFEAANGDELYIVDFIVMGGTGRFEDATGSVTGTFESIGPGQFVNYLDGEIQY